MSTPETATVIAWHEAVNAGDIDRLLALSSDDVEVGGPRGTGRGAQLLREWITRAGIQLEPDRMVQRGDTVVVEERARWRSTEDGQLTEPQLVASAFVVRNGRVTSVVRYPDMAAALKATGLGDGGEPSEGGCKPPPRGGEGEGG